MNFFSNSGISSPTSSPFAFWLTKQVIKSAKSLAASGAGISSLPEKIEENFRKNPLQDWEADRFLRGINLKMVKMEDYFIRVGTGKAAPLSLFVRNEKGLNVGLRRECVTQIATFVSLITDYGFSRKRTRFESGFMDVVITDPMGDTFIYAENKASSKILFKLLNRLENSFKNQVPPPLPEEEEKVSDDPLMKARHIWKNRPTYFWAVSPGAKKSFKIDYSLNGFSLQSIDDIPNAQEAFKEPLHGKKIPF